MSRERSLLTDVAAHMQERIRDLMDYYKENPSKPFGTERVGKGEARQRLEEMTPEQFQALREQVGIRGLMELYEEQKGGRNA